MPRFDQAEVASSDLNDLTPTEYRADLVITLMSGAKPVLAVVVEAQLRYDARKRRTWPVYVATLHARLGCPVVLLVVCPDTAVAARCAVPIEVSLDDFVLTPMVLGPAQVPVVDPEDAPRSPELAVLSALAHAPRWESQPSIFEALAAALKVMDLDHARLYHDLVLAYVPAEDRAQLETWMALRTEYFTEFARTVRAEGEAVGEAKGEAKAVLTVLRARGVAVPEATAERIRRCSDLVQLEQWLTRAATATTVDDLFA